MYQKQEQEHVHNLTMLTRVPHIFSYWNKSYVCIQGLLLYLYQDVLKYVSCGHKTVFCDTDEAKWLSAFYFLVTQTEFFSPFAVHT